MPRRQHRERGAGSGERGAAVPAPRSPVPAPASPRLAPTLRRAWYHLNQTFRRRLAGSGLTPDRFTVLRWLGEHPAGVTQRQLAELMASDANTIAALVARMERDALIERRGHAADARCRLLFLRAKGRAAFARHRDAAAALQATVLAAIPARERARFLRRLAAVADACAAADG